MEEGEVTTRLMRWLDRKGWEIISFDTPQMGSGRIIKPEGQKNREGIIPDIVAIKEETVLFLENKDHFSLGDFEKVEQLRISEKYRPSIKKLLEGYEWQDIFYGVGLLKTLETERKAQQHASKTDFILLVGQKEVEIIHKECNLQF